ncbi:MAG: substrate-binding domain-containing protein [Burkholderiaceae bacterium]
MHDPYAGIRGICSMATRGLLDELASAYSQRVGIEVKFLSAGGVDAARRICSGEQFDVVALASDAIDKLVAAGHLHAAGKVDWVRSAVGVAVRAGASKPDIATESALRRAVHDAERIAVSTGPSGVALMRLFERWGLMEDLRHRVVQAPPGVPVGALLARGDADIGFQQVSELLGVAGIELLGPMPQEIQILTTFSAAPAVASGRQDDTGKFLRYLASNDCTAVKRRHGMHEL